MKLIVGLGNPGQQYKHTRHNLGFRVLDEVAARVGARFDQEKYEGLIARAEHAGASVLLFKPLTFMNVSGTAVAKVARNRAPEAADILVVVDDIHIPLGTLRLRTEGSDGGHNGLKSIIEHLGTTAFPRLRIGIGQRKTGEQLRNHVLSTFTPEEKPDVEQAIQAASDAVLCCVAEGISRAMNRFNKRPEPDAG